MSIKSYRDLDAWQVAPRGSFGAVERCGRPSSGPSPRYRNHVRIALGSVAELSTCIELCQRLGYVDATTASTLQNEIARTGQLLHGLENSILRKLATKGAKLAGVVLACWWLFK